MFTWNIYILGVFTEKPYIKQLECSLYSNNNTEPCNVNDDKINHGSLQSDWTLALLCSLKKTVCKNFTVSILGLTGVYKDFLSMF